MTDKKKECKTCKTGGPACPLCTKEGIIMLAIGFLLLLSRDRYLSIIGFLIILAAYFIPLIRAKH